MSETEPMNVNERRKYLHKIRIRYWQAETKGIKSHLLSEMQAVTLLHRKSLIRLIKGDLGSCAANNAAKRMEWRSSL